LQNFSENFSVILEYVSDFQTFIKFVTVFLVYYPLPVTSIVLSAG